MAKTWSTSKGCWVDNNTGKPVNQGNHNVYDTGKKKWVNIPIGSKLPKPQPKATPK